MHCVIQTEQFVGAVKNAKLSARELEDIVLAIAENPTLGEAIKGTGGARKWRVPMRGKGKSGGYRVVSFYTGDDIPVFLLDLFAKNEKINLSKAERNELKSILSELVDVYRDGVSEKVAQLSERRR